ncbi:pre-mRNA-splicing factor CWC22 homolog isoform X2 [Metopolophium dirhodum]|nr:pre-mRNA-splicing factor CWC22 homolog isoform X2 [Metopolophium dirhodum]
MIRGKHMFCRFIISSQHFSTTDTHVYATLVAIINLVLPEIGKLVLKKCVMLFQSAFIENEILDCSASVMFIGHLINHGVADERLAIEILTNFLEEQHIFSIKIAIVLLEICGKKISECHKDILNEVFDNMLNFLNDKQLEAEEENDLKLILKLQENGFKFQQLDLVPAYECQITHFQTLESSVDTASDKISYHYDPEFEFHEKMYKNLILKSQGYDSEEENGLESVTDFNNQYDGEKELFKVMKHINDIEKDTNMLSLRNICLRKLINLTYLMTDYTKFIQQIVKYRQVDMDLFNMIIDCCCEQSTYKNHFGNLTKEFIDTDERFADMVKIAFIYCYVISDKFDLHRTQIVSSYFVHLLELGLIPYKMLSLLGESGYANTEYSTIIFQKHIE